MSKPTTIQELREELLDAYEWVKQDPRRCAQVQEMANTAGKVLASLKIEIEYADLRGEIPEIPFMGETTGRLKVRDIRRISA